MNSPLEIGFRFLPPDEEIIHFFLLNKMKGNHDRTRHMREVDILEHEPWDLPALSVVKSRYPEWLFFYKLNKISEGRNHRETKDGFWKSTGQDRVISYGGRVIGTKKTLVFYKGRTPRGVKTDWVMHQYSVTPDLIPPNAESNYVVGYLRDKAAENTESSISYSGQPSTSFVASTSQNNAIGVTSMELATQLQSNSMDYDIALQTQLEDQGVFDYDFSPLNALLDIPSSNNDQNRMEEEEISVEDLLQSVNRMEEEGISVEDLLQSDDEQNEWQVHFDTIDTIEEESDFMTSQFPDHDENFYVEGGHSLRPDYRPPGFYMISQVPHSQHVVMSGHGYLEGLNQKRMENGVHHDDILIMDSSVDSATVTTHEINCLESVRVERSVNSRTSKSQYEPRSHKSVGQGHPKTVQLQVNSSGKAASSHKTRESGGVVKLSHHKVQSNQSLIMDRDRHAKSDLSLRSNESARSSRNNFLEMSHTSCQPVPPLVYIRNLVVGGILFIFVVWELMFLH